MTMNQPLSKILVAATMLLCLTACGGGGGGSAQPPQQKTAALTFSTISGAHTTPLQAIQLKVKLPDGVTIPDLATALTTPSGNNITPGVYSAANQTASFIVTPADIINSPVIKFGQFAKLQCDVIPGTTLDQNNFVTLNTPFPELLMSGLINGTTDFINIYDPITNPTGIKVELSVTFGY